MNCTELRKALPDLLLNQQPLPGNARAHLNSCPPCSQELASLQSTFALLDAWEAPEPSPYFDQKLGVRLREEAAAVPAGWFERVQFRFLFNTGAQFRPMLAGALAVALLAGGAFAGLSVPLGHEESAQVSPTVHDLQVFDKNDQAIQQMDQLLQDDSTANDESSTAPRS